MNASDHEQKYSIQNYHIPLVPKILNFVLKRVILSDIDWGVLCIAELGDRAHTTGISRQQAHVAERAWTKGHYCL